MDEIVCRKNCVFKHLGDGRTVMIEMGYPFEELFLDFTGKIWMKPDNPHNDVISVTVKCGVIHSFDDEPAITYTENEYCWYTDGKLDRKTGPAISTSSWEGMFFIDGESYSFDEFLEKSTLSDEEKVNLVLTYGL